MAASSGYGEIVEWLLTEGGSSTEETDKHGNTVILLAASNMHLDIVHWLLLEKGVQVSKKLWKCIGWPTNMTLLFEKQNMSSLLLRTMLLSGPPPAVNWRFNIQILTHRPFIIRTCAHAKKVRARQHKFIHDRYIIVTTSLVALPSALFPLVLAYSESSVDEIWNIVGNQPDVESRIIMTRRRTLLVSANKRHKSY